MIKIKFIYIYKNGKNMEKNRNKSIYNFKNYIFY